MSATPAAGIGRRLGSLLYEALLVFSLLLIGFWIPQSLLFAAGWPLSGRWLLLHVFLLLLVYFLWFWLKTGQTLPMKTWKLRIVDAEANQPLRPAQALLRYLAAWPSIALGGIGILWAIVDPDHRFLHDRIAGTRIIDAPPTTTDQSPPA